MVKDTRLNFRIGSDLRSEIEGIAVREGRSVAQVCDAFLRAGVEAYRKQGSKFLQKYIARNRSQISQ